MDSRNPCAANDRRRVRPGRERDDCGFARLEDGSQRVNVFEFGDDRGLLGHSMGGYGATRIGVKHSDVFGSLYIMSPCCLATRTAASLKPEDEQALGSGQDAGRFGQVGILSTSTVSERSGVVTRPEEPATLLGPADDKWRGPTRCSREMDGQRASGVYGPIHRRPASISRDRD